MKDLNCETCPRCGNQKMKSWNELSADEKILVEKLPSSAELTNEERRLNRWCGRCWREFGSGKESTA